MGRKRNLSDLPRPPLYQCYMEFQEFGAIDGVGGSHPVPDLFTWGWGAFKCRYCAGGLEELRKRSRIGEGGTSDCWIGTSQFVHGCLRCGWWRYEFNIGSDSMFKAMAAHGAILRPDDDRVWAPVPLLRDYLRTNPQYLKGTIDPVTLEQVIGDVFSDFLQVEVRWTGRGADGGYDLYHIQGDSAVLYQVKRRGPNAPGESVVPIRALLGTMIVNDSVDGLYVTTADRFSRDSEDTVAQARERGFRLELVAYDELIDILEQTLPQNMCPYDEIWRKHWERPEKRTKDSETPVLPRRPRRFRR